MFQALFERLYIFSIIIIIATLVKLNNFLLPDGYYNKLISPKLLDLQQHCWFIFYSFIIHFALIFSARISFGKE